MKDFNQLPGHSRVWVYQADRELSALELVLIRERSAEFLRRWTSHDHPMDAAIQVFYNRFVIVAVDERTAPASGCGIDKSLKFIQEIEKEIKVSLLNRMLVAYLMGDKVESCSLKEFEKLYQNKQVSENTIVFNNLVGTRDELDSGWKIPLKDSWILGFSVK